MIKVVQLQTTMKSAGSSALRLHNAFLQEGIDSSIVSCMTDTIIDDKIKYLSKRSRIISKIDYKLKAFINRQNDKQYGPFSYPILGTNVSGIAEIRNADIIYLHWVLGGFLNLSNIEQILKLKKPVVFILHDMWYITGGCQHSFTCEKYITGCFSCQILAGSKKKDLSTSGFNKKLKLYSKYDNLYFVSPSQWLYNCAKNSLLTKNKPIYYIPNILDNKIFKPIDKMVARQILDVNSSEMIIAFGAVSVESPYKGLTYLLKALQQLYDQGIRNASVLIFGSGANKTLQDAIPFKTKFLGYLKDEYSVSLVYNAADVFIAPSLAETFGYVIMEALSCGTPVVGFDVGGIPDLIKHKVNGYLAIYKDSEDLANGIQFCIENRIKGKILPVFEKEQVINKHVELINKMKNGKITNTN